MRDGYITEEIVRATLERKKSGRLGQALVEAGHITERILEKTFKKQTETIFLGALLFREGHAALFSAADAKLFPAIVTIDTIKLLDEAEQQSHELAEFAEVLANDTFIPLRVNPAPTNAPPLSDVETKLLAEIDG